MKRFLALLAVLCLGLGSCYVGWYDGYYYDDGYYGPYYYGYDGWFVFYWVDPYGPSYLTTGTAGQQLIDLNATATQLAAGASRTYTPAGCANATASGPTVSYTFSNCSGHFGIGTVSGTTTLTLSQNNNGNLVLTTSSQDMTVDGMPSILDFTATVTDNGSQRTVTIDTHTRRPDQVDARHSQGTISWQQGSGCVDVTAQGASSRGSLSATLSIDGLHRCEARCPSTGTVQVKGPNAVFTGRFNGSQSETVSDPNGKTKSFSIDCQ